MKQTQWSSLGVPHKRIRSSFGTSIKLEQSLIGILNKIKAIPNGIQIKLKQSPIIISNKVKPSSLGISNELKLFSLGILDKFRWPPFALILPSDLTTHNSNNQKTQTETETNMDPNSERDWTIWTNFTNESYSSTMCDADAHKIANKNLKVKIPNESSYEKC